MFVQLFFILLGLFIVFNILGKVRKKRFSERESLLWIFLAIVILILSVFPILLIKVSGMLGIAYGPSLLFLMGFVWVVFILLRKEEQISTINEKLKELAQKNALLEEHLRNKK